MDLFSRYILIHIDLAQQMNQHVCRTGLPLNILLTSLNEISYFTNYHNYVFMKKLYSTKEKKMYKGGPL